MAVVFRVENETGGGMYRGDFAPPPEYDLPGCVERRPCATVADPGHYCGFRSLSAAAEWIASEEWLDALIRRGFRIVRYVCDARDVTDGRGQLTFTRAAARNTGYIGLHTIRGQVRHEH